MAPSPLPAIAVLQGETTGGETTGIANQAAEAARNTAERTGEGLGGVGRFFGDVLAYLTSTKFIGNVIAVEILIVLAIIFYRTAIRLIPSILRWRRPEEKAPNAAALARIKRQDTAVTLVRNTLRYVTFAIVALFIVSIFLRSVLPTVAGASILAAIVGFGARDFLRDIIAGFSYCSRGSTTSATS
jgi:moderate conductance mechanosensitive channel